MARKKKTFFADIYVFQFNQSVHINTKHNFLSTFSSRCSKLKLLVFQKLITLYLVPGQFQCILYQFYPQLNTILMSCAC